MAGCVNRHPVKVRLHIFETNEVRVVPKSVADRMIYHQLALKVEDFIELVEKGETMKVKILRNGKVCDMPDQNALSYIKSGQAVEVKAFSAPVADKKMKSPPKKKAVDETVFVCKKCGKTYKTERGFKNHTC